MVIKHECAQGPNIIGYRLQGFPCLPERQPRSLVLSSWKEVKSQRQATCELTLQKENAKLSFLGVKSWATLDFFVSSTRTRRFFLVEWLPIFGFNYRVSNYYKFVIYFCLVSAILFKYRFTNTFDLNSEHSGWKLNITLHKCFVVWPLVLVPCTNPDLQLTNRELQF